VRWIVCLVLIAGPAAGQTIYDRAGNPRAHWTQQGTRTYLRDNAGNPHGYVVQRSDGTIEHRSNAGDLISTER
jgi:hypothetical protein